MDAIVYDKIGKEAQKLRDMLFGLYPQESIENAPGAIASFDDGSEGMPIKGMTVNIEPVQAGSGDPSPENVRPISGWTGCNVTKAGKNLLPPFASFERNGVIGEVDNGVLTLNGTATVNFNIGANVHLKPGAYILTGVYGNSDFNKTSSTSNNNRIYITVNGANYIDRGAGVSFNVTNESVYKVSVVIPRAELSGVTFTNSVIMPMIRLASDADSTFEPYHGNTYNITFPTEAGTVYGGTLDVTNGVLTVDKASAIFNGSEYWTKSSSALNGYFRSFTGNPYFGARYTAILSNMFKYTSDRAFYFNNYGYSYTDTSVNFNVDPAIAGNTVDSWKSWLNEHNLEVVYYLETPITYQLTPQEVTTLLGVNNIWADTGDVTKLTYRADLGLYISKAITASAANVLNS